MLLIYNVLQNTKNKVEGENRRGSYLQDILNI